MVTPHSVCVVAPQVCWDDVRALWLAYGWDLGKGVPISSTGNAPITHWGAHGWLTVQEALDFTGRSRIVVPLGYGKGQVTSVLQQLRIVEGDVETDHGGLSFPNKVADCSIDRKHNDGSLTKRFHFDAVLATRGLQVIEPDLLEDLSLKENVESRRTVLEAG